MDTNLRSLFVEGRAQFEKGNVTKAEEIFKRLLAKGARFADLHCLTGLIHHDRGEFAGAIRHFTKALEINPDYAEARLNLMITYNDLGKYEEARKLLPSMKEDTDADGNPRDAITVNKIANSHAYTAELYLAIGDHENAARELERALAIRPKFADLRCRLGVAYRQTGRLADSVVQLVEALKINPNYVYARTQLGLSYEAIGQPDEAARQWELVLQVDPRNELAKTYKKLAESKTATA